MELTKAEMRTLQKGIIPDSLSKRLVEEPDTYCGVCGQDDCKSTLAHVDDEDLMHVIMGFAVGHPDGYCRKCGSAQTIWEMDNEGYECEEEDCLGLILHPAQHLGIM